MGERRCPSHTAPRQKGTGRCARRGPCQVPARATYMPQYRLSLRDWSTSRPRRGVLTKRRRLVRCEARVPAWPSRNRESWRGRAWLRNIGRFDVAVDYAFGVGSVEAARYLDGQVKNG